MSTPISGYQQGASYSAQADRAVLGAGMTRRAVIGDPAVSSTWEARVNDGVIWAGPGVSLGPVPKTGFVTEVRTGSAMVSGYRVTVPMITTLTHDAATVTARRDLIILRVRDIEAGDLVDNATVEIVKGTTTAEPVIPPRSLVLGQVNIRASASSILQTDHVERRTFTAAAGGVVPVAANAIATNPDVPPGTLIYDIKADSYYRKKATRTEIMGPSHVVYFGNNGIYPHNEMRNLPGTMIRGDGSDPAEGVNDFVEPYDAGLGACMRILKTGLYTISWHQQLFGYVANGYGFMKLAWDAIPNAMYCPLFGQPVGSLNTTCWIGGPVELHFDVLQQNAEGVTMPGYAQVNITRHGG